MLSLLTSLTHRPYVFIFLTAYLFLAWKRWGWPRTLLWLASGYAIAWASEISSITNGFPYGEYHYIYGNLRGELIIGGVPFFDSLSYPFLIFAGYTTAEFILKYSPEKGAAIRISLGALLTMLLDIIIDPLATMGDKWFLGKIHWYAHPGWYFGVPVTNFIGWFVVALTVIAFNEALWAISPLTFHAQGKNGQSWMHPAFYTGIALFNIAIMLMIHAWLLALGSTIILAAIALGRQWSAHLFSPPRS